MADIAASLAALTASLQDNGFGPSLETLSASATGDQGPVGDIVVSLESLTGVVTSPGFSGGSGALALQPLSIVFTTPDSISAALSSLTGAAAGDPGVIGTVTGLLAGLDPTISGDTPIVGSASLVLSALGSSFIDGTVRTGTAAASLRALQAVITGAQGQVGTVSASLKRLQASATGDIVLTGSVAGALPRAVAYISGGPEVSGGSLDSWTMNTRNNAVTKYPAMRANSYASYNRVYLMAGPDGIYTLGGDLESTAQWKVRTGQFDDKRPNLKRLTELLLGARYSGTIKARVWKDGTRYFDYVLSDRDITELQQVRVKVGKGLKSRYYMVELSGTGGKLELDSLQMTMPDTHRRIG